MIDDHESSITTARLRLVPATLAMVDHELEGPKQLARYLDVTLPGDWPPEHHDRDVLRFTREALEHPGSAGWWLHYAVVTAAASPTLAGTCGYKGPPSGGAVEIGYSIVPSWRRRGLATEACGGLIEAARQRGADVVRAHTLPHLEPSIGVLQKLGLQPASPPEPGVLAFELRLGDG